MFKMLISVVTGLLIPFGVLLLASEPVVHRSHGLSRFDQLKYPKNFTHFDYVNPDAPKGGEIRLFSNGTFDTLNPYATNGQSLAFAPSYSYMRYGFTEFNEPLMVGSGSYSPSGDEIKTAYGLIAKSIEYPDDNRWIIFNLRPEARFHDGHPITADDVIFSYKSLKEKGHPRYKMQLETIEKVEKLNPLKVKFTFKQAGNRIQLFRAAELPVLPEHYWSKHSLDKTTLIPPLNSGPYQITDIKPGTSVTFSRVKDYWGKELPVNKGRYNFDKAILYFFQDFQVAFESFKGGGHDLHIEISSKNWATAYDFAAVKNGTIKQQAIPHKVPSGSAIFHFNTRRPPFNDIRVRQAVSLMLDFEWTRKAIFHNSYKRSSSYFPNTIYAAQDKPSPEEIQYLMPWKKQLPETLFKQPFTNPVTSGDGIQRKQQKLALQLLQEAGWVLKNGILINKNTGKQLQFAFITTPGINARYQLPFKKNLAKIGIDMQYQQMDSSQLYHRIRSLDFDMVPFLLPQTNSPDTELESYFHSSTVNNDNTRNISGINHPVIDALVLKIPQAKTQTEMQHMVRSLDRVLMWNYYGIPTWYNDVIRVAHRDIFGWPETGALYTPPFSAWWRKKTE